MDGIALCYGIGGLELGLKIADENYRTIHYVEREEFCVELLKKRIEQGIIDAAPITLELDDFVKNEAEKYKGKCDIIAAGFPCQPASVAGRRKGTSDSRWLWPTVAETIRKVEPKFVFLENVRGLLSVNSGSAFGEILRDLANMRYDVQWEVFSAGEVGAPQNRSRVFILANSNTRRPRDSISTGRKTIRTNCEKMGNSEPTRLQGSTGGELREQITATRCEKMDDTYNSRLQGRRKTECTNKWTTWPPSPTDTVGWNEVLRTNPDLAPALPKSEFRGLVTRIPKRVGQLKAYGNSVVPIQAAVAFLHLRKRFVNESNRD